MSADYRTDKQGNFIAEVELKNGNKIRIEIQGRYPYSALYAGEEGIPEEYADLCLVAGTEWGDRYYLPGQSLGPLEYYRPKPCPGLEVSKSRYVKEVRIRLGIDAE